MAREELWESIGTGRLSAVGPDHGFPVISSRVELGAARKHPAVGTQRLGWYVRHTKRCGDVWRRNKPPRFRIDPHYPDLMSSQHHLFVRFSFLMRVCDIGYAFYLTGVSFARSVSLFPQVLA